MDKKTKQQINDILNKYFKWMIFFTVIFILIIGYFLIIQPKYEDTMTFLENRLNMEKQDYLNKKEKMQKFEKLMEVYGDIDAKNIDKINTLLPNNYSYERLFTEISSLVSKNGMLLTRVNINEHEGEASGESGDGKDKKELRDLPRPVKTTKLSIDVIGVNYSGLKSLLSDLETNSRMMDVINVTFNPANNSAGLDIQTYYFDEKKFNVDDMSL